MSVFDDILATRVDDATERETLKTLSEKYGLNAVVEDWDGKLKNWEGWKDKYLVTDPDNPQHVTTKSEVVLRLKAKELEDKVKTYETAGYGSNDVDFDTIIKEADKRYFTKEQVESAVTPVKAQTEELKNLLDLRYRNMDQFYWLATPLFGKYAREFNEDMDSDKFRDFYVKGTEADPRKAYDSFVSDKRTALQADALKKKEEASAAAIEAARQEGIKMGKQEANMSQQSVGMPADQGGPDGMGHLQQSQNLRLSNKQDPEADPAPGMTLGQGLARAGLEALYKARASGTVQ